MKIRQINQSQHLQNFKALNYNSAFGLERSYINKNLKELTALGEKYDITLTSAYFNKYGISMLDIDVRPLKNGYNILTRLFRPIGRSKYITEEGLKGTLGTKENFMEAVHDAINELNKKLKIA